MRELRHAVERARHHERRVRRSTRRTSCLAPGHEPGAATRCKLADYNLETVENRVIQAALEKNAGNVSRAAKELGITRASLYRRMEKYGL